MEQIALTDMTEAQVLAFAGARHQDRLDAEVDVFRAAYQWSVLHNPDRLDPEESKKPGREKAKQIAGPGTPMVTEYAAAAFGARVGTSPWGAQLLIADAQDVYLRLPNIASLIENGKARVSHARKVAEATRDLSPEEAGWVDAEIAGSTDGSIAWTRFLDLLKAKVRRANTRKAKKKEEQLSQARFAKKVHTEANGMGTFMVRSDIATINQIDAAVTAAADRIAQAQADLPADQQENQDDRRVHAMLLLANPGSDPTTDLSDLKPQVQLYLHAYPAGSPGPDGTAPDAEDIGGEPIVRLEGHGALTESWITRVLGPNAKFRITPVLDLEGQAPVDAYEIPSRHRQAVHLITPADIFPYAANTTRTMEIDHTIPHARGGPSAIGNYGPMTRRHHRTKTHTPWQVQQPYPGIFIWRDPYGAFYLVDHTGTRPLEHARDSNPHRHSAAEVGFTRRFLDWAA
jgi:hypothetical protein